MKHIRTIAMAAMTAMALFAFGVGSASATTLEDSNGVHPETITASVVGSATLSAGGGAIVDTCTGGSVSGPVTTTGSATTTVKGTVAAANVTWSGCTNTTHTIGGGELEIHHKAGTSSGTVTGTTFEVTIVTAGVTCTYGLTNTDTMTHLGTLTGSDTTAILDIDTTVIKRAGSFLCPASGTWQANYHITHPSSLTVTAG